MPMTVYRRSVVEMQRNVNKQGKRNAVLRFFVAKGDKDKIAGWNRDLIRVLHVFNVRSIGSVENLRTQWFLFRRSWRSILT